MNVASIPRSNVGTSFVSGEPIPSRPEEILFEREQRRSRAETTILRDVAEKLEAGEAIALSAGGESFTLEVPVTPRSR